jgi:hypothetical protein
MGGGTASMGGGSASTGGGSASMGGGTATGGGTADAGCTPYVIVANSSATETALVDDGTIRAMYVAQLGTVTTPLFYAECTSGCAGQNPTFAAVQVPLGASVSAVHVTAAPRTSGGIVAAVSATSPATLSQGLYFAECASSCTTPANWVITNVDNNVDDVRPGVAMLGPVRAIGYGTHANTMYAECTAACDSPTNWSLVKAAGQRVQANARVALHDAGTQIVRLVANDQDRVASCTVNCTGAVLQWTSSSTNLGPTSVALSYIATPTQQVVGVDSAGDIRFSECSTVPCAGQWTIEPNVPKLSLGSQLDLGVTPQGDTSLVLADNMGLWQATFSANGWSMVPVMGCGQWLVGQQPSQRITSSGGISVLYSTNTSVLFHAP